VLLEIAKLPKTNLETAESLEQLRWIENGYIIKTEVTSMESIAIDTPDDLLKIKEEAGKAIIPPRKKLFSSCQLQLANVFTQFAFSAQS
jgi:hypothetical protein